MKRILITLICVMLFLTACSNEKLNGIADCVNSIESNNFYNLSIIANREEIDNKEQYALELIEQVRNNDFKKIQFSYDLKGYPVGLEMRVYLTEQDKAESNVYMCVRFTQENIINEYNIVDDYDKFVLEII